MNNKHRKNKHITTELEIETKTRVHIFNDGYYRSYRNNISYKQHDMKQKDDINRIMNIGHWIKIDLEYGHKCSSVFNSLVKQSSYKNKKSDVMVSQQILIGHWIRLVGYV